MSGLTQHERVVIRQAAHADLRKPYPQTALVEAVEAILNARLAKAVQFADLLHKAHAVCEEVVMDTPEERALHERHCEQMRDLDSALLGVLHMLSEGVTP